MADFATVMNDTQKRLGHVNLTKSAGGIITVTGLVITAVDGSASTSQLDDEGAPLPTKDFYVVSGSEDGESHFSLSIDGDDGNNYGATVTATVVAGLVTVSIDFDAPVPK